MIIVLIAPSGVVASALDQLALDPVADTIVVVAGSRADAPVETHVVRTRLQSLAARAERLLGGSAIGRNLIRVSPLDKGRRFASAVRRHDVSRSRIAEAELVVVLERDGLLTGWLSAHRWTRGDAHIVYGLPAARTVLST